jgi:hypothetical protein
VADVVEAAAELGCRLDGWSEHFDAQKWQRAIEQVGLDLGFLALQLPDLRLRLADAVHHRAG